MAAVVAVVVLSLSLIGDGVGASTPQALRTKSIAWKNDCQLNGISASTVSLSCGLAAVVLTIAAAVSGCAASGGAACCLVSSVRRSLRAAIALWVSAIGIVGGLALYAFVLVHLARGEADCSACKHEYEQWLK